METYGTSNNFMLYLMLLVSSILVFMNTLEIYKLSFQWNFILTLNPEYLNSCVKYQYIVKSFFCVFSFFATFSALILVLGLLINIIFFTKKLIDSYINFIYFIFGPLLLICSILGFYYFDEVSYVCSKDGKDKNISVTNVFSLMTCFFIGALISITKEFYSTMNLYADTITRKSNGNKVLYTIFWNVCTKIRSFDNYTLQLRNNNSENNSGEDNIGANQLAINNSSNIENNQMNRNNNSNLTVLPGNNI